MLDEDAAHRDDQSLFLLSFTLVISFLPDSLGSQGIVLVPAILFHFTQLLSTSFISVKWTPKTPTQLPVQETAPDMTVTEAAPAKEASSPKSDVKPDPSNDMENAPVNSVKDLSQSTVEVNVPTPQEISPVCHKHAHYDTN